MPSFLHLTGTESELKHVPVRICTHTGPIRRKTDRKEDNGKGAQGFKKNHFI